MQRFNLIEYQSSSDNSSNVKKLHRKKCLFGTLGQIKKDLEYLMKKDKLNLIDKRLLLGIFQKNVILDVDIDDNDEIKELLDIYKDSSPIKFR